MGATVIDGRFALEAEHKRGGMGTVWKALDLATRRPVALKLLHVAAAAETVRFVREAKLLADLAHGGIVAYVAHGATEDGVPYLAMEWLDGETLAERLARAPLGLRDSLACLRSAARGLAAAHRRGIVHRDLKPSNLFLRGGAVDDVVILDLGVARPVALESSLTRTGAILGTPSYMAPEQAQGARDVGPAADVYALGCVLYECLIGDPPFLGESVFAVLARVLFEDAPGAQEQRPELPPPVVGLVDRMLAKDAARRPADAAALLAALAELGALPDAPPPGESKAPRRTSSSEQELVSVLLATAGDAVDPTLPAGAPPFPDPASYGAELRRLGDGTTVITLAQRGGGATDLAMRAARCALRIREGSPGACIVLCTGRGIPRERGHIGEAVDRAGLMLRGRTRPGIWLDEVTARLLDARFHTEPAGDGAYSLDGEERSIDPTRPLLGRPTACVGREHELGTLELTLRACIDDAGARAVLVLGQPGMGKSRLRHELVRRVQGQELLVLLGLGDPIRASSSSGLLGGAVARLCGFRAEAAAGEKRAALQARVGPRVAAFLGELCGVPGDRDDPELRAARGDPRTMARRIEEAWLAFLRAETARRPVLLVLDDLQWSDPQTVALVDVALRELAAAPFMVLALARPEAQELFPDLWAPRLAVLPLQPLGAGATARLVRQVLGPDVPDEAVQRLVARAAGNALYLEELIRAEDARRDTVPESVLAMLQARIGQLAPAARRALRAASVFGESFPLAGVQALLRAAGGEDGLEACLATLDRNEILEPQPGERDRRWRFRHVLMRDAAYALFDAEDRVASHALAARFLEGAGEDPAVVAAHCERGDDRAGAVRHYLAAADRAYRRADHAATVQLAARGLAAGATGEQRGALRSVEAPARFYRYDFLGCWEASGEAIPLLPPRHPGRAQALAWRACVAMQLGKADEVDAELDEMLAAEPAEEDRTDFAVALGFANLAHTAPAHRAHAQRLVARLAELDALAGDESPRIRGYHLHSRARFLQLLGDDPYAAWIAAAAAARSHERTGDVMLPFVRLEEADCVRRLFSPAEGTAIMREALRLAEAQRNPVATAYAQQYLAGALVESDAIADVAEARALAEAAVATAAGDGNAWQAFGQLALALANLRLGEPVEAERLARAGRATLHAIGMHGYVPHADAALLQVLTAAGDPAAGALADEALATVERFGPMGSIELPLRLAAARAHLACGRAGDAARGVAAAVAILERRAAAIPDAELRRRFLADVPENAELLRRGLSASR